MYKTYSSPNLKDKFNGDGAQSSNLSQPFFVVGDRVLVDKHRAGSVAYFGELDFSSGDWVGVVLDEPSGNHDGKIHGREYFHCSPQHGLFVRPSRLRRLIGCGDDGDSLVDADTNEFQIYETGRTTTSPYSTSSLSSRAPTPAQAYSARNATLGPALYKTSLGDLARSPASGGSLGRPSGYATSSGRSTTESCYYYDDDYRNPVRPSIESLERKLKSINANNNQPDRRQLHRQAENAGTHERRSQSVLSVSSPSSPRSSSRSYDRTSGTNHNESVFNFRPQRVPMMQDQVGHNSRSPTPRQASTNLKTTPSLSTGKLLDFSSKPLHLHDRIVVKSVERNCELTGTLRYLGQTEFATGEWVGVELDEPEGRNNGTVLGVRYFRCPENHGLFVPVSRVSRLSPKADLATNLKSTIKSPPPRKSATSAGPSPSPVASSPSTPVNHRSTGYRDGYYQSSLNGARSIPSSPSNYIPDRCASSTPSPSLSSSLSPSPSQYNRYDRYVDDKKQHHQPNYGSSSAYSSSDFSMGSSSLPRSPAKFKESDLDTALKRYTTTRRPIKLTNPNSQYNSHGDYHAEHQYNDATNSFQDNQDHRRPQARSIKYTFKSSKYDGNPIALKTVEYD